MKNHNIILLANSGFLGITSNELSPAHAYKVFKAKKVVKELLGNITESEKELVEQSKLTVGEGGKLEGEQDNIKKFIELRNELYNEDADVSAIKAMPYDEWHALQKENDKILYGAVEDVLEGILWNAPEE